MSTFPITVVITRHVKPEYVNAFEQAVRDWLPKALAFPGHLGVLMLKPPTEAGEYGAVLKFSSEDDWHAFKEWPEYVSWLESLRPFLVDSPKVHELHGLEAWYQTPAGPLPPPRWKMALVTWMGVNLTVFTLTAIFRPLLSHWPLMLEFVTFNGVVVAGLTWFVMPLLSWLTRPWLIARSG